VVYSGQLVIYLASAVLWSASKLFGQCCTVLYSGQLAIYLASAVQWSASKLFGQCCTVLGGKLSDHLYTELRKKGEA